MKSENWMKLNKNEDCGNVIEKNECNYSKLLQGLKNIMWLTKLGKTIIGYPSQIFISSSQSILCNMKV